MSLTRRLRTVLLCAALEFGVLSGVPMRPDEIRALMDQINQPKVAHVMPADEETGDAGGHDDEAHETAVESDLSA